MNRKQNHDVEKIIRRGSDVDNAIVTARRRVVEQHRQTRIPLVIWRDGRVVEVEPETVPLPNETVAAERESR